MYIEFTIHIASDTKQFTYRMPKDKIGMKGELATYLTPLAYWLIFDENWVLPLCGDSIYHNSAYFEFDIGYIL